MPSRVRWFRHLLVATALLGLEAFLTADPAPAQAPKGPGAQRLMPAKDFTKEGRDDAQRFQTMRRGDAAPQKDVIDRAAQWYAYRLTWTEFQDTGRVGEKSIKEI